MFTGDDATADDAATTHRRIDGHWARNEAGVSDARRWRSPLLPFRFLDSCSSSERIFMKPLAGETEGAETTTTTTGLWLRRTAPSEVTVAAASASI